MHIWKSWAESKGLNDDIVEYKAKELDEYLSQFVQLPSHLYQLDQQKLNRTTKQTQMSY